MLKLKSISLLLTIWNCIHISFKIILVHYINVLTFLLTISCRLCFTFLFSILYSVCSYLHFNIYCFLFLFMPWFKQTLSNNIQSLRELLITIHKFLQYLYLSTPGAGYTCVQTISYSPGTKLIRTQDSPVHTSVRTGRTTRCIKSKLK